MVGLPGSGKTTLARKFVAASDARSRANNEARFIRVSRDDLRRMQGDYNKADEDLITLIEHAAIEAGLRKGYSVVVDACNLNPQYVRRVTELVEEHRIRRAASGPLPAIEVETVFMDVPLRECLKRNHQRPEPERVPNKVIHDMYRRWLAPATPEKRDDLPTAIICDLDGTLALLNGRSPYDASTCERDLLNEPVATMVDQAVKEGHCVILMSGRDMEHWDATVRWLHKQKLAWHKLFMRPHKDTRKDAVVKRELYEKELAGKYNIAYCLDDRDQIVDMWRSLGLMCYQVSEGWF